MNKMRIFAAIICCFIHLIHTKDVKGDDTISVSLHTGWNIFSVNVLPDSTDMKYLFAPLILNESLVKVQDESGKALENLGIFGGWWNFIGNIALTEGYKIKVNANSLITFTGKPASFPFTIPLKPGWNLISYPVKYETNGLNIVQQLIDRRTLLKVQDEEGKAIEDMGVFGGWQNYIGNFRPGKGYKIKVSAEEMLILYGMPQVITSNVSNVTTTTATTGGQVVNDGGSLVLTRGICWNTTGNPTVNGNKTTDGSGTGSFTSILTGLLPGTAYFIRAYATNSQGTAYGEQLIFMSLPDGTSTVTDADGNVYRIVTIGTQDWIGENLRTTRYKDGTPISGVSDGSSWSALTTEAYCWYNNNETSYRSIYGALYNWYAINDSRGLCPEGWHVPSDTEWTTLENYLINNGYNYDGTSSGNKIGKALADTLYWQSSPFAGSVGRKDFPLYRNKSGFSALPGGGRAGNGTFDIMGSWGIWWSSTPDATSEAWARYLGNTEVSLDRFTDQRNVGYSVRCIRNEAFLPTVTTAGIDGITTDSASGGGNVTVDGGAAVIARGLCWNTTGSPTTADPKTFNGIGTGVFSGILTGLSAGTTYYVRAWATNFKGTAYGNQVSFTTSLPVTLPAVTTSPVTGITQISATGGGNVTSDGNSPVTTRGLCWNSTGNPTTADFKTTDGSGKGGFVSSLNGLSAGTTFYARAWATNSRGTAYGSEVVFTTRPEMILPTVSTASVTDITRTTAKSGGNVTHDGNGDILGRGVCWNTTGTPTVTDQKTTNGTGIGSFTSNPTGLTAGTTYYLRAWAANSLGTGYGEQVAFTTSPEIIQPTVTTASVSDITGNTATGGGNVTEDGGDPVTARGICLNTAGMPTINDNIISAGAGTGIFTSGLTGLSANTLYYIRAWATNSKGTAYGNQVIFVTRMELTTGVVTAVTSTTASVGGTVLAGGGAAITAKGICWNYSGNPTIAGNKTNNGTGAGSFAGNLTSLTSNAVCYARAYATNNSGTAYGDQIQFTTLPSVTTSDPTQVKAYSAVCGGITAAGGGAPVLARGVCWNTTGNPVITDNYTSDGTGTGPFTSNLSALAPGTTYFLRAYASNSGGTSYGNQVTLTTTPVVYDADGNLYFTVKTGTQMWLSENLKTTTYNDGTPIQAITGNEAWITLTDGAFCYYNNDENLKATYGALYNWYAVNSGKLCPAGWHVPSEAEWTQLVNSLGGELEAGGRLKEPGVAHWVEPNTGATNESGFTALPGGIRGGYGVFYRIGELGYWWSTTPFTSTFAVDLGLYYNETQAGISYFPKEYGFSVRCLKD